jgi:hypothetical protein
VFEDEESFMRSRYPESAAVAMTPVTPATTEDGTAMAVVDEQPNASSEKTDTITREEKEKRTKEYEAYRTFWEIQVLQASISVELSVVKHVCNTGIF